MVAELKESLGVESQLIKGGRGIFDVKVDGVLVFSKHEKGRFPNPGEVPGLIQGQ